MLLGENEQLKQSKVQAFLSYVLLSISFCFYKACLVYFVSLITPVARGGAQMLYQQTHYIWTLYKYLRYARYTSSVYQVDRKQVGIVLLISMVKIKAGKKLKQCSNEKQLSN